MITQERLKQVLHYNQLTGRFTWLVDLSSHRSKGKRAGWVNGPYRYIGIDHKVYSEHALAFIWMIGVFPEEVDHKDRKGANNIWRNLRVATHSQNHGNRTKLSTNTSGYKGVCWDKSRNKWMSHIMVRGKRITIGRFNTPEQAAEAYRLKALELFGEFARCS